MLDVHEHVSGETPYHFLVVNCVFGSMLGVQTCVSTYIWGPNLSIYIYVCIDTCATHMSLMCMCVPLLCTCVLHA